MEQFVIQESGTKLIFFNRLISQAGFVESYDAKIENPFLSAVVRVQRFNCGEENADVSFFSRLSENWRGWKGQIEYNSLEAEIDLIATSDSTGHIKLSISLTDSRTDFYVKASMNLDAGQLPLIYLNASKFFTPVK